MEIFAELPDGEVRSLTISISTTTADVLSEVGLLNAEIEFEGEALLLDKTLSSIGISSGDTLRLSVSKEQEAEIAVKAMGKCCNGETLIRAVVDSDFNLVKALLIAGIPSSWQDPESNLTPAHYAALDSNVKALRLLKQYDANFSATDCTQKTPLHYVSISKKGLPKKAIEFLCGECGVDPDPIAFGETPLILACQNNNLSVVISLVSFGALVNNTATFVSPLQAAPSEAKHLRQYLEGQGSF